MDANGTTRLDLQLYRSYDPYNRLREVYANFDNAQAAGNKVESYTYDDVRGMLSNTKYYYKPNAQIVEVDNIANTYDVRDRLTATSSRLFSEALSYDANPVSNITSLSQNYNGNINGINCQYNLGLSSTPVANIPQFGGPTSYAYTYDALNRLGNADARVQRTAGEANSFAGDERYTYDRAGNITALSRGVYEVTTNLPANSPMLYTYYNGSNRLQRINENAAGTTISTASATSQVNTLLKESVALPLTVPDAPTLQALSAASYVYDANGNMIKDQGNIHGTNIEILYGRANLPYYLKHTVGTNEIQESYYQYDCKDSRLFKYSAPQATGFSNQAFYYLHDMQGHEIGILDMNNHSWEWYVQGAQRVARIIPTAAQQPEFIASDIDANISPASVVAPNNPAFGEQMNAIGYSMAQNNTLPDQLLKLNRLKSSNKQPLWMLQQVYTGPNKPTGSFGIADAIPLASNTQLISGLVPAVEGAVAAVVGDINLKTLSGLLNRIVPPIKPPVIDPPEPPVNPVKPPFTYGPDPLVKGLEFYEYDHLGNTRVVYSPQLNGSVLSYELKGVYDYYASGKLLRSYSANNDQKNERYLTTQHERDAESGYDFRNARFSDSEIGGIFRQVDPLAEKFPRWSPYNYVFCNPIRLTDPSGMAPPTDIRDKEGNTIQHIEDGSNAVFQLTGNNRSEEYFKFTGYDEKQGGENKVNVESAVKGAQDYTREKYTSDMKGDVCVQTYCNYGTMNVAKTYESATVASGKTTDISDIKGSSRDIGANLASSKKVTPASDLAAAQKAAKEGSLVVGYWPGHVFTLNKKGFVNNVGAPRAKNNVFDPQYTEGKKQKFYIIK